MAQQFSTSEVREVLGKAIEQQAAKQGSTKLGFDELLAVAAEVGMGMGIDVESLREPGGSGSCPPWPGAWAWPSTVSSR